MPTERIIVVIAATGGMGSGVVSSLLADSKQKWTVRAVCGDTTTDRARKLLAKYQTTDSRLSVVAASAYDAASMRRVVAGAYGIFAMTLNGYPGKTLYKEEEMQHEIEAGRILVDVAKDCGVKHFVFQTLPDMTKVTHGKYTSLYHMTNKSVIEQYLRQELVNFTCYLPGYFYNNLTWPQYSRRRADGVVRFCAPVPGNVATQWLDSSHDVGVFVTRIFALGPEKTRGKIYPIMSPMVTMDEMAATFARITSQTAVHEPISVNEFADLAAPSVGPAFWLDSKQMMQWAAETPQDKIAFGSLDPDDDISEQELGVRASTFEEWMMRSGWTGPQEVYDKE